MSKAFTALAILKLRDSGKLSLDAPLERYIPQALSWHYPTSDSPRSRVRDLLGHVGGFGPDDPWSDRQQPMREQTFTTLLTKGLSFNHAPQTQYEYSSLGYALLGRVITNVSGRRYDRYIESAFLRPLGMNTSGYEIADVPADRLAVGYRWENDTFVREPSMANGVFGAMGGVHTSANDYARWVGFLLSAWPARDGADTGPARRATVRELAVGTSFPRLGSRPGKAGPCAFAAVYAAGFSTVRDCDLGTVLTHNGGYPGYGSTVLLMPEFNTGVFAFANLTYARTVGVVFDTAQALKDAGLLKASSHAVSETLAHAYARVGAMYRTGNVTLSDLSVNFLMDRSAENWRREFERLKNAVGSCSAQEPIAATGLLSGEFTWQCERGSIRGTVELSPTNPPLIQTLALKEDSKKLN
jgi:CubicO group peptidase (beta-lactamase class C family)